MNRWAAPLIVITILVFGVLLFMTQSKPKDSPTLPDDANTFKPISPPAQNQQGQVQGQQTQAQQQVVQATLAPEQEVKASYSAVIKTTKGNISVILRGDAAPRTVKNFIIKADSGFYKNLSWHRVEDWVIQGGDPQGDGSGGGSMQTELNQLPFTAGSLGIARKNDIRVSNDAQFFITKKDASWLNEQYTNFGQVTAGMDVVQAITVGDKILSITVEN